jgi:putative ATP-binding cassette transporter
MVSNGRQYKDKRSEGDLMFANVYVFGELLFTVVIGAVAFIFPLLFEQMGADHLRNYVFVFLYMTGPINGVLNAIPQILNIRISWNRIKGLIGELEEGEAAPALEESMLTRDQSSFNSDVVLTLENIAYHYGGEHSSAFTLGPIDYTFRTGNIVFITGGNGSGKSTFSKVFTGLCQPDEGVISINGRPVDTRELGELFSAVFSEFHLFDRLYGIDTAGRDREIAEYLALLQLEDKVTIKDGSFSTTKLSTGQRKRLALLLCYLDDRPFYLFDEWAADQDPEYREFFYTHLMQEMKRNGKGVIAITHDDRYFHLADHIVKLEFGQIVRAEQFAR